MTAPVITPGLSILDNGLNIDSGQFQYAWFRLNTPSGERWRCVTLTELVSVPLSMNDDADTLGRQRALVRGLYNAGVEFLYLALGIFQPEHIGIVQMYGSAGEGATEAEAARQALAGLTAVRAGLANFPQSLTAAPDLNRVRWYLDFVSTRASAIRILLGQPDPRSSVRSTGRDGGLPESGDDDLALEQNELLFRGMAKIRQSFVFQVTARYIGRQSLTHTLTQIAEVSSNIASRRRGSINIGFSLGIPLMAALSHQVAGSQGAADSQSQSTADGVSHGWGQSHTESESSTVSGATTIGEAHTVSHSSTTGGSISHGTSVSDGVSASTAHSQVETESSSHTEASGGSTSVSSMVGGGSSSQVSGGTSLTNTESSGTSTSTGTSSGETVANSHSASLSNGLNVGGSAIIASAGVSYGLTESHGLTMGTSVGESSAVGASEGTSTAEGSSTGWSEGQSSSWGESSGSSSSWSSADTTGHSSSSGVTESQGTSHTEGQSETVSQMWSSSSGEAHTTSRAETSGWAHSRGTADGVSENWGQTHMAGQSAGQAQSRSIAQGWGSSLSTGLMPGMNIGRSWQTEDHVADLLTEALGRYRGLVNLAAHEGGFMTDALLLTDSDEGARAAEALAVQSFHGDSVPTPVLTIPPEPGDDEALRTHALAFLPCELTDSDPFGGALWTRYSTLLATPHLAAYTAPGLVEEATTVVTIAPTPRGLAFYPNMTGDVVLGHQYSPLTRDLTPAQVRLDPDRLFHTMFAADTGYGKSVAAMRMAYETTLKWHTRTVVLDFGAGWRALLNAPGLEGHVAVYQLWPDSVRSMRWNPLQIGRNINPETQWRAFADIFGSIARLGVRRQKQELLDALRDVYLRSGTLVDDPVIRSSPSWGQVRIEEQDLVKAHSGTPLGDLTAAQRQQLAVLRSSRVGLMDLYNQIKAHLSTVNTRDTMLTGVLEGIKYRLNALVQGAAATQFAPGPDTVPMEDLAKPWGVAIIEGGAFLDDFGKAFLLGWAGWHLYTDMVARRVHAVTSGNEPMLQIFFEEANKIFGGVDGGGDDESGGVSLSQRFGDMFRDARKYHARLHVITQAPSLIPQDIISSCNNLVIGFLKNPDDKNIVLSGLARSEKGFVDEPWRRFLSDLARGMFIGRFPYTDNREQQQPILFRPLMVAAPEPNDDEIAQKLGRIRL